MNKKLLAAGLAVAATMGFGLKPAVADTIGVTVVPGARSANTTDLVLPPVGTEHIARLTQGQVTLWADDSSGSGAGWNVTVQASDFTGPQTIPAANLSAFWEDPVVASAGDAVDPVGGPSAPGALAIGSLDVPRKLMSANAGFGKGTYSELVGLSLEVPADTLAGSYSTTLTVSITAGP